MVFGNMPNDGGYLLLTHEQAQVIEQNDLISAQYIRSFLSAEEFINNIKHYCLWLKDSTTHDRKASPEIQRRMQALKSLRLNSSREIWYLSSRVRWLNVLIGHLFSF